MFTVLILFILGLVVGSFINALEYRIEEDKSIGGRSFCPNCKHQLAWFDLIPVISWIVLGGKCRYCKKQISVQYPVVELLSAITFAAVGYASGLTAKVTGCLLTGAQAKDWLMVLVGLVSLLFISFCFVLIALYDYKTSYILSKYVYFATAATVIYLLTSYPGQINNQLVTYLTPYFFSAIVPTILFGGIYLVSKGKWLGEGDIELAFLMGLFLGWPKVLIAFYFACIVGSLFGLGKIYLFKKAKLNSEIPFAPFLIAGTFFAFVFGQQIFDIYVRIVLGG